MDVQKSRGDKRTRTRAGGGWPVAQQLDLQPAFLFGFAQCSDFRILIQFYVPAQRQPFVQVAMMDDQDFAVVNDKDGHRKINFLVDMSHSETSVASAGQIVNSKRDSI